VAAGQPGHRDEEVLREELRAADDDEDERDAEAERAEEVADVLAEARRQRRRDRRERDDPEDDVEAGDECRRRQLEARSLQAPPALGAGALEDLVRLWRGGDCS
jgi:hypothetical protein